MRLCFLSFMTEEVVESIAVEQTSPDKEVDITSNVSEGSCKEQVSAHDDVETTQLLAERSPNPPYTSSIIFDNLDFVMRAHHQSTLCSNQSIHWINHIQ